MDFVTVFTGVLMVFSAVVLYFIIPYINSKVAAEDMAFILKIIDIAVRAAEQMYQATGVGEFKKEKVIEFIRDNYDINITDEELSILIESAVKELNLWQAELNKL